MTLQSSGAISLSDIAAELNVAASSSLRYMSNVAGKTIPDSLSEFYGFSYIPVQYGSITYTYQYSYSTSGYRTITHTNHALGQLIDITLYWSAWTTASAEASFYYRKNSGSWQWIASVYTSDSGAGGYTIYDVDYNDVIEVRIDVDAYTSMAYAGAELSIDSVASAGGNCKPYLTGTFYWWEYAYGI